MEKAGPVPALQGLADRLLVVVVDHHPGSGSMPISSHTSNAARGAPLLVAVRVWIMTGSSSSLASVSCRREVPVLELGLLVVADLADRDHPLLEGEAGQPLHDALGQLLVVGLLGVQPDGAVVADAELPGAEPLPSPRWWTGSRHRCRRRCAAGRSRRPARSGRRSRPPPSPRSRRWCARSCGRAGR